MRQLYRTFLALPLITGIALTALPSQSIAAPSFAQYRVTQRYNGRPAAVNLNSPQARRFRTVLTNGARRGPNFAGQYTVVTWGCGTECQQVAIVDAKTGRVYMTGITASLGVKHQLNSRLLVVNPPEEIAQLSPEYARRISTKYYIWQNNTLRQISSSTNR
ncbi:MAG TPA: hypothetical protein V6D28_11615 [Leptolyngbyaceae cyanobacterium]